MKKLLVLLMVLGLAASAQAQLSLSLSATSVAVDGTITADISDNVGEGWTWQFIITDDTYWWTVPVAARYDGGRTNAVTARPAAGDLPVITPDGSYASIVQLSAGGSTVLPSAGVQFTVAIECIQIGYVYINLMDWAGNSKVGGWKSLWVPEPMTIALLGLGGLFLRRRK
jgi:hypothetical protein